MVARTTQDDKVGAGSQTLMRGLDVVELVAQGKVSLTDLCDRLSLTKSTAHRLATALVARGYLASGPRGGAYRLGAKFLELGEVARRQNDVVLIARPHLEDLAADTSDTIHLGVFEGERALYLDKVPGQRRINISSRIGEMQPLTTTGLGRALLLDHDERYWQERWTAEHDATPAAIGYDVWRARMHSYVGSGWTYDLEENEDRIRCVAAPIRGAHGQIVAALSVSSAAQYMDDARMQALTTAVKRTASAISSDLGYQAGPGG